ncbi:hypothetical protein TSOC_012011 [Tetrabaena socialis]|uniref:Uncharacterized protein n=1 Tax=Tetrabaena socialis TaxID=47790 RepID=A0A2J7ZL84_9CHLO|nr:hypothetical protein TSOC_013129 [Tetrabaena socialis]PNH02048.1 hypothetical protein TSOC_012011 [Tetrabaena socialis]|eukprot:PNH01010.1 hypothetical protein TSOC_013129 [Tetrabaena socialis]
MCKATAAAAKEEELRKEADEARALVAAKEEELSRLRGKAYEEVPKEDNVYICKEASELNSDRHKIGKAIDTKKREVRAQARSRSESQLNTGSAQGSKMIFERSTLNAKLIEDIAYVTLKRYHCAREHYNSRVEHSVDVLDIACTVVDIFKVSKKDVQKYLDRVLGKPTSQGGDPSYRGYGLRPPYRHPADLL